MNKKLFLHIGLHKTGSSALQKLFYTNRERFFDKCGLYFPEAAFFRGAHHNIGYQLMGNGWFDPEFGGLDELVHEVEGHNLVLVSSEELEFLPSRAVNRLVGRFKDHIVHVIMFVRRQEELINSVYNQQTKIGVNQNGFEEFFDLWIQKRRFDLFAIAKRWGNAVGSDNVHVLPIEGGLVEGKTILDAMFKVIDVDLPPSISLARDNQSVSAESLRVIKELAERYGVGSNEKSWHQFYNRIVQPILLSMSAINLNERSPYYITKTHCERVESLYGASNCALSREFLGKSNLFATSAKIGPNFSKEEIEIDQLFDLLFDVLSRQVDRL